MLSPEKHLWDYKAQNKKLRSKGKHDFQQRHTIQEIQANQMKASRLGPPKTLKKGPSQRSRSIYFPRAIQNNVVHHFSIYNINICTLYKQPQKHLTIFAVQVVPHWYISWVSRGSLFGKKTIHILLCTWPEPIQPGWWGWKWKWWPDFSSKAYWISKDPHFGDMPKFHIISLGYLGCCLKSSDTQRRSDQDKLQIRALPSPSYEQFSEAKVKIIW